MSFLRLLKKKLKFGISLEKIRRSDTAASLSPIDVFGESPWEHLVTYTIPVSSTRGCYLDSQLLLSNTLLKSALKEHLLKICYTLLYYRYYWMQQPGEIFISGLDWGYHSTPQSEFLYSHSSALAATSIVRPAKKIVCYPHTDPMSSVILAGSCGLVQPHQLRLSEFKVMCNFKAKFEF